MIAAIFGGTFDPIHQGHIEIIKQSKKKLFLDCLFIVPTSINPLKSNSIADADKRLMWVKKVLKDIDKIEILDFEIKNLRPSYTIDTVKYITDNFKISKLYLIIGADNIKNLNQWRDFDNLKNIVKFIIVTRNSIKIDNYETLKVDINISSSNIRDGKKLDFVPKEIKKDVIKTYKLKSING